MRAAAAQQKRFNSSSTHTKQNAGRAVAVTAGAIAGLVVIAASTKPAENSFFSSPAPLDLKKVKSDICDAIEAEDSKRGDGTSIAPTLVRLAWHASGTYSIFDKTGGSDGATMRFKPECAWGANAGLAGARAFMENITKKHPKLSTADAWTLAGGDFNYSFLSLVIWFIIYL